MSRCHRLTLQPEQLQADPIVLTPEQQHYLGHVLRLGQGDHFIAMDGQGQAWVAELQDELGQARLLQPTVTTPELPIPVNLCIALLKNNALEPVIHQATELGVTTIYPLITHRSLPAPSLQKLHRWQRIAQEAAEQSQRLYVPRIAPPQAWSEVCLLPAATSEKLFCSLEPQTLAMTTQLNPRISTASEIWLAIGPEGGWTEAEMQTAAQAHWNSVSLGQRTLRAMTAAIVGLGLIASYLETPAASV